MAVSPEDSVAPLACGRDAALVWDRAAAGAAPDEHERICLHCQAAYADAQALDAVVHRMAAQRVEPPDTVLDRVMNSVITEFLPRDVLALPSPHGPAWVSTPAAAGVLRRVVDAMGGLRARSCRIEQHVERHLEQGTAQHGAPASEAPHSTATGTAMEAGAAGSSTTSEVHAVDVRITVVARFGVDLRTVTARVRQMVIAAGEQAIGVPVRRVDIDVVDLLEEGRT